MACAAFRDRTARGVEAKHLPTMPPSQPGGTARARPRPGWQPLLQRSKIQTDGLPSWRQIRSAIHRQRPTG